MRNRSESYAQDEMVRRIEAARVACCWRDVRDDLRPAEGIGNAVLASVAMVAVLVAVVML